MKRKSSNTRVLRPGGFFDEFLHNKVKKEYPEFSYAEITDTITDIFQQTGSDKILRTRLEKARRIRRKKGRSIR